MTLIRFIKTNKLIFDIIDVIYKHQFEKKIYVSNTLLLFE